LPLRPDFQVKFSPPRLFAGHTVTIPVEVVVITGVPFMQRCSTVGSGLIAVLVVGVRVAVAAVATTAIVGLLFVAEVGLAGDPVAIGVEVGRVAGFSHVQRRCTIRSSLIAVLVVDGLLLRRRSRRRG
jgi:hypothetical protein